jgi:hypothetical protein
VLLDYIECNVLDGYIAAGLSQQQESKDPQGIMFKTTCFLCQGCAIVKLTDTCSIPRAHCTQCSVIVDVCSLSLRLVDMMIPKVMVMKCPVCQLLCMKQQSCAHSKSSSICEAAEFCWLLDTADDYDVGICCSYCSTALELL